MTRARFGSKSSDLRGDVAYLQRCVRFGSAHYWFWAICRLGDTLRCLHRALAALVQTNAKRMLAYSSIAHAGYILVAFAASTAIGTAALLFYLAAYALMKVGAFLGRHASRPARGKTG